MENRAGKNDPEERTLAFSVAVVRFVSAPDRTEVSKAMARQLLRSATSIGANYREANRAESRDDFIHKTGIAQKEAAEADYWLEICRQARIGDTNQVTALADEARQLLAIFTTINRTAKGR
ncbi:MAG: four helix bundle protein [Opitutae bacterium]|nr:four helix bundle protein [Opitutae bacterium]